MVLPDEDKYSTTRTRCSTSSRTCWAGRAEELVFHDPTTGAATTSRRPPPRRRAMVTQYGMTERLGAIKFGGDNTEPFLGREMAHPRDYSEEVAALVDEEVKKLIETAHNEAWEILVENRDVLDTPGPRAAGEGDAEQGADRRGLLHDREASGPPGVDRLPGRTPPPVRRCSLPRSSATGAARQRLPTPAAEGRSREERADSPPAGSGGDIAAALPRLLGARRRRCPRANRNEAE